MKKKMVGLMLCACTALAAAGCGGKKFDNPDRGEALIMATNAAFEPYEYYDEGGQVTGIDVEIAQALADKLGLTLEVEDMEFESIISAVNSGKAHIGVAGMTVTEDRLANVDFTDSYTTSRQVIIVQEGSAIIFKAKPSAYRPVQRGISLLLTWKTQRWTVIPKVWMRYWHCRMER